MVAIADKNALRDEIVRCGRDPVYFITKYVKIQHPTRGLIPFDLFDFQEDLLKSYIENRFNIILKARQLGISETTAAYAVWLMLFHRDKNILVMASKAETAKNIIKKVKNTFKHLPRWLFLADITTDNRMSVELNNGSQIKAIARSEDAGRSEALSLLILDEAAHIPGLDDLWTGLYPTVTAGGSIIVMSTPNGVGNKFHKLYVDAEEGLNEFKTLRLMWWKHPEHISDLREDPIRPGFKVSSWYFNEIKSSNYGPREVSQELECLRAGTRIITPDGFKCIEELDVGDLVLTHLGRFRRVNRLFSRNVFAEQMRKINLPMSRKNPVYITKNHPILSRDGWKTSDSDVKKSVRALMPKLRDDVLDCSLNRIDLSESSKCVEFDDNSCRYHRQHHRTNRFLDIDYDFGRIIGLYVSEGCKDDRTITFAFNSEEIDLIEFISNWATTHGMSFSVNHRTYSKCTTVSISNFFLSESISRFVDGKNCHDKILTNDVFLTNKRFLKGIIDGVWEGDGLHNPVVKNVLRLANERLIYQIRMFMTMFGLFTRVSHDGNNSWYIELNNTDSMQMRECTSCGFLEKKQSRCKFADDLWWGTIRFDDIDLKESIQVYNIEVDEDDSYVCENLVVHNCNFNASGETMLPPDVMDTMEEGIYEALSLEHWDRNLFIWFEPEANRRYFISADVARGDGRDNSAAHVWDLETMSQQAEYYGKIPLEEFAKLLVDLGHRYNNALLVVENNSIGIACLEHIRLSGYENVYYSRKGDEKAGEAVNTKWGATSSELVIGFTMSPKCRPMVVAKLEEYVRTRTVTIRSGRTMNEMRTFIWMNGKPQAMKGYNDDLVMAAAIGSWIRDTYLKPDANRIDVNKRMVSGIRTEIHVNTEILGASKDPRYVQQRMMGIFTTAEKNNPYKLRVPSRGGSEELDLSWLIKG